MSVMKKMPLSQARETSCKEIVFFGPKFGIAFQRETDTFGYKPIVMVQSISFASPAAGLIGPGDQLLAVDRMPIV